MANALVNNKSTYVPGAIFDALVDPVISFAPEFDATGYTVTLSEGVGNSAVPEPDSALLLGAGVGLVLCRGALDRRA